jgi:hypothetical protein
MEMGLVMLGASLHLILRQQATREKDPEAEKGASMAGVYIQAEEVEAPMEVMAAMVVQLLVMAHRRVLAELRMEVLILQEWIWARGAGQPEITVKDIQLSEALVAQAGRQFHSPETI